MAKSFCTATMCPNLSIEGSNYCKKHQEEMFERQRKWKNHELSRGNRGTAEERGYNKDYLELRREIMADEPMCEMCRVNPATELHHRDHDSKNNRRYNLMPICKSCHRVLTRKARLLNLNKI